MYVYKYVYMIDCFHWTMPIAPGTKRREVGQERDSKSSYHLFMLIRGASGVPL